MKKVINKYCEVRHKPHMPWDRVSLQHSTCRTALSTKYDTEDATFSQQMYQMCTQSAVPALAPELLRLRLWRPHWVMAYGTAIANTNRIGDNGSQMSVQQVQ